MGPITRSVRRVAASLRLRFLVALLALAVLPLVAVATVLGQRTFDELEQQSVSVQRDLAASVGFRIESAITVHLRDLELVDQTIGFATADLDTKRTALRSLLANEPMYEALALTDAHGHEVLRTARHRAVLPSELEDRSGEAFFSHIATEGTTYFGHVAFDEEIREPLTTIAYPIFDRRTDRLDGVLVATITLKPMWELLATLDLPPKQTVYVLNTAGEVVAHQSPSVVLQGTSRDIPAGSGRGFGLTGEDSVVATYMTKVGNQPLTVVAERPLASALALATRAVRVTVAITALAILGVVGITVLIAHRFVRPIEDLAQSARRVSAGDVPHPVRVRGHDEIADLAEAFNRMTSRLNGMIATLERRVRARTRDLERSTQDQQKLIAELEMQNERMAMVQRQLEQSIKSKDEFLGSVSHELRTPLASVVGFASLLRDRYEAFDREERSELIGMIAAQGQDMSDIIDDLLVVARSDIGTLAVEASDFEIDSNLRAVADQLPDAAVRINAAASSAHVRADERRVRQILRNLIVNAVRYGGDDISVVVDSKPEACVVLVRDNGEGIPEAEWESVFDLYHRADRNGKVNPASIGLGLTVSRKLARLMGGDLTYRYEDGHSVFELTLPLAEEAQPAAANAATSR